MEKQTKNTDRPWIIESSVEELKAIIQRNYDNGNWRGVTATERKNTIAAQLRLIELTGTNFEPVYNCYP